MLSGRLLQKLLVLASAFTFLAMAQSACKKKSGKKGGSDQTVEQPKTVTPGDVVYGKEVVEGNSAIYRGTDKVFMVKGQPNKAGINQPVALSGQCGPNNEGKLTWNFGQQDSATQVGPTINHPFNQAGTYHVTGTCDVIGAAPQVGTLTIVVSETIVTPNNVNGYTPNQNCGYCLN